jgi:hypothetical protein
LEDFISVDEFSASSSDKSEARNPQNSQKNAKINLLALLGILANLLQKQLLNGICGLRSSLQDAGGSAEISSDKVLGTYTQFR